MRRSIVAVCIALALPVSGQAQDPGGQWRTLDTPHFRVHFRPRYRALGVAAAAEAERAWSELGGLLPPPRRAIDLVVSDNVDYANGFTTVYPVPTIVVYAFPPPGDLQLADYDRWLRLVITHELTHAFHLDDTRGWWRFVQRIFGRVPGTFPNQYTPTWLTEGIAVFYESKVTGEGRLEGAFHRSIVDARVAEQGPLPMGAAGGLSPVWPGGIRPYAFGATFFDYLTRERGDSVMPRLVNQIARRPLPYLQLNGALTRAAGVSFTDEWDRWMAELRRRPPPAEADGETVLLCCQRSFSPPHLSPDGRRLLFVRYDGRNAPRLAVWDRDSARLELGPLVNTDEGVAWLGDSLLVAQLEYDDPYTIRSDLAVQAPGGGPLRRLTHEGRLREPDAAQDGRIVAVRTVAGSNELVIVRGDSVRVLVPAAPGVEWATPRFNPDGLSIAAIRVVNGRHDLVVLDTAGAVTLQVTSDSAIDRTPAFAPNGQDLVWAREVDGVSQIVAVNLADGRESQLTHAAFGAYAPAPADDSLFYLSYHADGFRLVALAWPVAPEPREFAPDSARPLAPPPSPPEREHGYSPFPALFPQYWLPSAVAAGPGMLYGAISSSQDPLGRHAWLGDFGIGTGAARGRWRGSFYYLYAGLPPAVIDAEASHEQNAYYLSRGGVLSTHCCVAENQAAAGVSLLHRRWRTLASVRFGGEYDYTELFEKRLGASVTGSLAHVVSAPLAISTQEGYRLSFRVRSRWRRDLPLQATDMLVTGAGYLPGGAAGFAGRVFGARVALGAITGTDSVHWGVGGLSGGTFELVPGVVVGEGLRSFPVRGYPPGWIEGRNAASVALEMRTPWKLVGRGPSLFPPVTLDRLSTVLFVDAGAAWSRNFCPASGTPPASPLTCSNTIGSAGGELVIDAGIPYDFPVRIRAGAAWRFDLRSVASYAAIGSSF